MSRTLVRTIRFAFRAIAVLVPAVRAHAAKAHDIGSYNPTNEWAQSVQGALIAASITIALWILWYRYVRWRCPGCGGTVWIERKSRRSRLRLITLHSMEQYLCTRCGSQFVKLFHFR